MRTLKFFNSLLGNKLILFKQIHEKANDDEWHEMTFVVNQKNIDYLKKRIEKTSDLDSHMYGKHLSFEEVGELVRKLDALHSYDCLRANKSMMARKQLQLSMILLKSLTMKIILLRKRLS